MFEAQLKEGILLKKTIDAIKDIVSEANFDVTPSGISMQSMDRANVTLVVFQLKSSGFDTYRCDRSMALGLSIGSLARIMKCGDASDAITLRADESHADTIGIVFESVSGGKVSEYELKLMDLDVGRLTLPEEQYEAYVRMSSTEFQRVCRDLTNIDDSVQVMVTKEAIKFKTKGELGSGCIVLKNQPDGDDEDPQAIKILMRKPVSLHLSLKFLSQFTKATSLSPTVTIGMSYGIPMLVEYPLEDCGYLRFYLAPKVGDDEYEEGAGDGNNMEGSYPNMNEDENEEDY